MDRNQAWEIVCEFVKSDSLRKHLLAVEACVAAYARKTGEDEEKWREPHATSVAAIRPKKIARIVPPSPPGRRPEVPVGIRTQSTP